MTYKIKRKEYARPLILSELDFAKYLKYVLSKISLTPGKTFEQTFEQICLEMDKSDMVNFSTATEIEGRKRLRELMKTIQ